MFRFTPTIKGITIIINSSLIYIIYLIFFSKWLPITTNNVLIITFSFCNAEYLMALMRL